MSLNKQKQLSALRDQIDALDDQIHDLLMERTRIVEGVRELKKGEAVKIRPGREAEIIYRLLGRHAGNFPSRELFRIWREIIVATLGFEGPFSVAVQVPEDAPAYWDLARDQYGAFTRTRRFSTANSVVEAVRKQDATLGVLPLPRAGDAVKQMWWRFMVSDAKDTPKVIARLPFAGPGNHPDARGLEALVICPQVKPEATGRDRTYIAVEAEEDIPFRRIKTALSDIGHSAVFNQLWHDPNRPAAWTYLVELFGFVDDNPDELGRLKDKIAGRVTRIVHLGVTATPLSEQEYLPKQDRKPGTKAKD